MTFAERWEQPQFDNEYLKFDHVQQPTESPCRDLCVLLFVARRFPGPHKVIGCAEHDQIWFGPGRDELETLTDEEILYLQRCGCNYDPKVGSLMMYY